MKKNMISTSFVILLTFSIVTFLFSNSLSPYVFNDNIESLNLIFLFSFIYFLKISDGLVILFEAKLLSKFVCIPNLFAYLIFFILAFYTLKFQIKLSYIFIYKLFEQGIILIFIYRSEENKV